MRHPLTKAGLVPHRPYPITIEPYKSTPTLASPVHSDPPRLRVAVMRLHTFLITDLCLLVILCFQLFQTASVSKTPRAAPTDRSHRKGATTAHGHGKGKMTTVDPLAASNLTQYQINASMPASHPSSNQQVASKNNMKDTHSHLQQSGVATPRSTSEVTFLIWSSAILLMALIRL